MNFYLESVKKYATFSGRARRKEYWMYVLFYIIFTVVASIVDLILGTSNIITGIYGLVFFVPTIAVVVRRLHDIGKSGWWLFVSFIPLIGGIWFFVLMCLSGQQGENKYGQNPKELI
ncbi:MAG: DUF805 domain-containing protein [Clostridium butyricum]|nr:DUF805 domain-containing protein [Clostridium butyricum]